MKKIAVFVSAALFSIASVAAFATDIPDGPVASPPGYSCTAKNGTVTCVKLKSAEPQG